MSSYIGAIAIITIFITGLILFDIKIRKNKIKEKVEKFTINPLYIDARINVFIEYANIYQKLPLLVRVNGELPKSENYTIHFRIGNVYGLEANKSGIEDLKNNFLVEKMITI